jgi:hypothetical protein
MTVAMLPDRADIVALLEAVQKHKLASADLPAYLAGLAASRELKLLAAELERERLSSVRLASRLEELLD